MPRKLLKKGLNDPKVQEYFKLMIEIADLFGVNKSQAEHELKSSLEFEIELAKVSVLPCQSGENKSNVLLDRR